MTQLTLGYSDSEDRLWLIFTDDGSQLWLTRRMTLVLLQHLAERMTISCPGAAPDLSLKPEIRVALEFEAAHEADHDPLPQESQQQGNKADTQAQGSVHVISSITLKMGSSQVQLITNAPGYQRTLCMSRAEAHRMLGALARRSQSAGWNMPNLPPWLQF